MNTESPDSEFFPWLKRESERHWEAVPINREISGFQVRPGTKWLPGLSEDAIAEFEKCIGFAFPDVYRSFLRTMNGTDQDAVNVFGESGEPFNYRPEYYSFRRDFDWVVQQIDWICGEFGVTRNGVNVRDLPHVLPIVGHRFLVIDRCAGNPVLSMWGTDTIVYAPDLKTFLVNDILHSHAWAGRDACDQVDVPFWIR